MSERFRLILFIIFSITILWFTIILLCLPQGDEFDQRVLKEQARAERIQGYDKSSRSYRKIEPPKSPEFMRFFQPKRLSHLETLFYQFKPALSLGSTSSQINVTKSQHEKITFRLNSIDSPTDQMVKDEGDRLFAFNLLASNRIGLSRALPDTRPVKCPRNLDDAPYELKQNVVSIVICYYNEAPSALLRTIYSIINQTPTELINEIIIVDDFSEAGYDMDHIKHYLSSLPHHNLITFLRTARREGLIRARLFGAEHASGEILVFLDSHVEANVGWLQPLLHLIQQNKTTIACPMIDLINAETMIYSASPMVRGGLTWALHFKWDSIPADDLKTYDDFAKPVKSASMAGGLYAINREFFNHLGSYDSGMNLWGGENIELSLRAWMCGGQILVVPCSRLGHIFRKTRPYSPAANEPDSLLYNSHRSARVWLSEEHLIKFYESSPEARTLDSGNIDDRLEIRKQLKCNNFTWFINNIYPALKSDMVKHTKENEQESRRRNLFATPTLTGREADVGLSRRRRHKQMHRPSTIDSSYHNSLLGRDYQNQGIHPDSTNIAEMVDKPLGFMSSFYSAQKSPKIISTFQIQLLESNLCIESKTSFIAQEISRLVLNDCAVTTVIAENKFGESAVELRNSTTNEGLAILDTVTAHPRFGATSAQLWSETESHDYRLGPDRCLDIMKNLPILRKCNNMRNFQTWSHLNLTLGTYISDYSNGEMCLAVERARRGEPVIVTICDRESIGGDNGLGSLVRPDSLRLKRQKQRMASENKIFIERDAGGGGWLTGSLPLVRLNDHHAHHQHPVPPNGFMGLNQKWNLIRV